MRQMNSTTSARATADQERVAGERNAGGAAAAGVVVTRIPARLERLPWGRFHVLVVAALGVTWILDGLEVTLAGSVGSALKASPALRFSDPEVGLAGSAYLSGAVLGALFFGWLTDRLGRKKLFFITIAVYLSATALTGLAWNGFTFFLFRFITGAGIGGEYAAINSTIQELIPAQFRGHLDLMINGCFWVGAALGALVAVALLNPSLVDRELGWRLAFLTGAAIHSVPLSDRALEILRALHAAKGRGRHVFPGARRGVRCRARPSSTNASARPAARRRCTAGEARFDLGVLKPASSSRSPNSVWRTPRTRWSALMTVLR
jgi:MFS family permease